MTDLPAVLLLADGTAFHGRSVGKVGVSGGEICFNTGMTGYQEIYTDPSYYGQIIVTTASHIGNYGVLDIEDESRQVQVKGVVIKEFSAVASRHTGEAHLQDYLEKAGIVGICDIDTRRLVRHIRTHGAMNALISSETLTQAALQKKLEALPNMDGLELSSRVSVKTAYQMGEEREEALKVAVLDVGIKKSILTNLTSRGCCCKVFPAKTNLKEMMEWNPDGFFISNGPGDPAAMDYAIETVRGILKAQKPLFGICLGHQLLALAAGAETYKLHHGHRGLNHPVKNLITNRSEITSQNHGFSVKADSVGNGNALEVTHINLNDQTIAGLRVKDHNAFSVQHHPEASPGPHDSQYLFDQFVEDIKQAKIKEEK